MTGALFYAFLMSLLIGTVLTPCLMLGAKRLGLLDLPSGRKIHKEPIGRVGGIAFAVGALVASGYWLPHSALVISILAASLIIVGMGSLDDFLDLRVRYKFGGQFLAAGVVVGFGHLTWQPFSMFLNMELSPWVAIPLTMIMLVAMTNAVNLADGMDGLAGGLAFLSFGLVAYLAYQVNDVVVLYLTLPVMGGLLGFLRFNTYPARVFMGDSGSQFLGFFLGTVSLILTQAEASPLSPLLVLFFIGLPLMDMVAVTTQRLLTGKGVFLPDQVHLHHKLLSLGFSHHRVVLLIYLLQIGMVLLTYTSRWSSDLFLGGLYLLLLAGLGTFYYGVYSGRLSIGVVQHWAGGALYWRTWLQAKPWLAEGALYGLAIGVVGFFLLGVVLPSTLRVKEAYLVGGLGVLVLGGLRGNVLFIHLTTRMGLYLSSTFVLYSVEHTLVGASPGLHLLFQGFFGLLIGGLFLAIHLDKDKRFTPNPMDYLLLFLALVMPFLLDINVGNVDLGSFMAKLIVLFFVCEVLLQAFVSKGRQLGYFSGVVLLGLAARAFW